MGLLLLIGAALTLVSCGGGEEVIDPEALRGGETRGTLSPSYFSGKVATSYKAAREIPEILDSLYCYCDCKKHAGHKSLLTCYVDRHAANCDICINEALIARNMHKNGEDVIAIRKAIDGRYKR